MPECLRIIIAGSRTITDYRILLLAITNAIVSSFITPSYSFEIVSGGAIGVDTLARRYAHDCNYLLTEMKPKYKSKYDPTAPLRRNIDIANYGDILIAVWDGKSAGTKHIINYMKNLGKPVFIHII